VAPGSSLTRRRLLIILGALVVFLTLAVIGKVHYLFVSSYRVTNQGPVSATVRVTLDTAQGSTLVAVRKVLAHHSQVGWLHFTGEAGLGAQVVGPDGRHHSCSTYIEGSGYHTDIIVGPTGEVACRMQFVLPSEIGSLSVVPAAR
jgi:hypothetical protein